MFHIFGINVFWFMTSPVTFALNWNFQPNYTLQFQSTQHYSTLQYCRKTYIFPLKYKIWLVPFTNMSLKNVFLLDFSAVKNVISHHTFHIQYTTWKKERPKNNYHFLSTFIKLQKWLLALSCLSACLSVCPHRTTWFPLDGFDETWCMSIFEKINFSLKSDKNNSYFT